MLELTIKEYIKSLQKCEKRRDYVMEDKLQLMAMAILILFIAACTFELDKQDKKINEQENKIQQQIELIDALQQ